MHRKLNQYPSVFLHTGDFFLGVKPTLVTTVLGSCVAVTMFAPRLQAGVICHAFLPDSRITTRNLALEPQVCRFVDTAMPSLFGSMARLGCDPHELIIKVFGGGSGFAIGMNGGNGNFRVGQRNIAAVLAYLEDQGLAPTAQDVGGEVGRKIHFLTHTGEVWVKRLPRYDAEIVEGMRQAGSGIAGRPSMVRGPYGR
ncbi:MAG: chemotaxis protein CheD [Desulfovibrionaceae bacterium]